MPLAVRVQEAANRRLMADRVVPVSCALGPREATALTGSKHEQVGAGFDALLHARSVVADRSDCRRAVDLWMIQTTKWMVWMRLIAKTIHLVAYPQPSSRLAHHRYHIAGEGAFNRVSMGSGSARRQLGYSSMVPGTLGRSRTAAASSRLASTTRLGDWASNR